MFCCRGEPPDPGRGIYFPSAFLMESYRATGIADNGEQRGHTQLSRSSRPNSNGAGTYGLSIRVQGIDGHPYVVLNNQDKASQSYAEPNSNGYLDGDGSFIENYEEYDFRGGKEAGSNSPFTEYRSQTTMYCSGPQNGVSESQGRKSSNLLNFQKHPELLQPYDPETNSLNIDRFHSLPPRPVRPSDNGNQQQSSSSKPAVTTPPHVKTWNKNNGPQEKVLPQTDAALSGLKPLPEPLSQPSQPPIRTQAQVGQPASKPSLINPYPPQSKLGSRGPQRTMPVSLTQPSTAVSPTAEPSKPCRSPSSMSSTNSSLERTRHEPDVLPLRRTDSSGPVLQATSRSRHSSSSSTTKSPLDGHMEALYADTINRHENRRYIPFIPGSGRDIDTGSIPGVDELIEKFDGSHQRRGRAGRRNRINPEDRKRSHSVDSGLGLRDGSGYLGGFNRQQSTSVEHVLRPSQLQMQKTAGSQDSWLTVVDGKPRSRPSSRATSAPGSPQNTISNGTGSIQLQVWPSSQPVKSRESKGSGSSARNVLTASLSTTLSKTSSSTGKKPSSEADVLVNI